jgi:hypothetical protein
MKRWVALIAIVLAAAACGSTGTGSGPLPSPSSAITTPSSTPTAAALIFKLSGVGTAKASGTMTVTTQGGSLSVELKITGLQAGSIHVSHIHNGTCANRGGILRALNPVIADSQGVADIKSTLNLKYPPASGHLYVVVHVGPDMSTKTNAQYLLCGNLFK